MSANGVQVHRKAEEEHMVGPTRDDDNAARCPPGHRVAKEDPPDHWLRAATDGSLQATRLAAAASIHGNGPVDAGAAVRAAANRAAAAEQLSPA